MGKQPPRKSIDIYNDYQARREAFGDRIMANVAVNQSMIQRHRRANDMVAAEVFEDDRIPENNFLHLPAQSLTTDQLIAKEKAVEAAKADFVARQTDKNSARAFAQKSPYGRRGDLIIEGVQPHIPTVEHIGAAAIHTIEVEQISHAEVVPITINAASSAA